MNDIEAKALALVKRFYPECPDDYQGRRLQIAMAAIEQHEAFKQEVSDALEMYSPESRNPALGRFIIPKSDPLVEVLDAMKDGRAGPSTESYAACLRAALDALGFEIREKNDG
jgi:hypothetical protein